MNAHDEFDHPLAEDAFISVKHFARSMLKGNRLLLAPLRSEVWNAEKHEGVGGQNIMSSILFRSGCWQVELLCFGENTFTPMHRHNFCASADVLLNGDITGNFDGESVKKPRGQKLAANVTELPVGAWHGASTEKGLIVLSFQKWIGREPTFIANDWEAFPT